MFLLQTILKMFSTDFAIKLDLENWIIMLKLSDSVYLFSLTSSISTVKANLKNLKVLRKIVM